MTTRFFVFLTALLALAPLTASAQTVATSFQELQNLVKPGDTIDVTNTSGTRVKGRLGELSASDLKLLTRGSGPDGRDASDRQFHFSESDIQSISIVRRDSLWNGALIGFTPGATVGTLILFMGAGCDCYTVESRAPLALGVVAIAGGIGAAVGAAVDALMYDRPIVYYRAPERRASRVQISPLVAKSAGGIQMSVRF
jgi:hypothetical protein